MTRIPFELDGKQVEAIDGETIWPSSSNGILVIRQLPWEGTLPESI